MKTRYAALALLAALTSAGAFAQLKLPGTSRTPPSFDLPAKPATQAAPAAAPAPAPDPAAEPTPGVLIAPPVVTSPDAAIQDKQKAGEVAAGAWLLLLDAGDYGRAWDVSSTMFRSSVPLGAWMDGIPFARRALGATLQRKMLASVYKTTLAGRPDGDYVTVGFITDYANRKGVEEIITAVREGDGHWRVVGYAPG